MKKNIIILFGLILIISIIIVLLNNKKTEPQKIIKLKEMEDLELADVFYNSPKIPIDFIKQEEQNYSFSHESVNNLQEALEDSKKVALLNGELIEVSLVKETEYYYLVYREYISRRNTGDVTFKDDDVYFKNSVLDYENKNININIVNDKDKIREILNLYIFLCEENNYSVKILESRVEENKDEYLYTYYCFETSYGDFALPDDIKLCKNTISISKLNGKYQEINNEIIRQVKGYKTVLENSSNNL